MIIKRIQEVYIQLFLINSFGQLLDISPKNFIFLKIFNTDFSCNEEWFTDQNCNPLKLKCKNKNYFSY